MSDGSGGGDRREREGGGSARPRKSSSLSLASHRRPHLQPLVWHHAFLHALPLFLARERTANLLSRPASACRSLVFAVHRREREDKMPSSVVVAGTGSRRQGAGDVGDACASFMSFFPFFQPKSLVHSVERQDVVCTRNDRRVEGSRRERAEHRLIERKRSRGC